MSEDFRRLEKLTVLAERFKGLALERSNSFPVRSPGLMGLVVCDTLTARSGRCSLSAATSDVFPVPDAAATTNKKASIEPRQQS